jgi:hypothetical protein
MKTNRRTFFQWLTSAAAGSTFRPSLAVPVPQPSATPPDAELLLALGRAILPGELGAPAIDRLVTEFGAWLAGYRPRAELDHGYGASEIEHSEAHPGPRWMEQLKALDRESRRSRGKPFPYLSEEERRELVRAELAPAPSGSFPRAARAEHVAMGLLAYFVATPEATDLCYQAEIGKDTCRDLAASAAKPAPIPGA